MESHLKLYCAPGIGMIAAWKPFHKLYRVSNMLTMNCLVFDIPKSDAGCQSQSALNFHSHHFVPFASLYDTCRDLHMAILYKNANYELAFEKLSKYKLTDRHTL